MLLKDKLKNHTTGTEVIHDMTIPTYEFNVSHSSSIHCLTIQCPKCYALVLKIQCFTPHIMCSNHYIFSIDYRVGEWWILPPFGNFDPQYGTRRAKVPHILATELALSLYIWPLGVLDWPLFEAD